MAFTTLQSLLPVTEKGSKSFSVLMLSPDQPCPSFCLAGTLMAWQKPTECPINREPSRCWPMNGPRVGREQGGIPEKCRQETKEAWQRDEGGQTSGMYRQLPVPWDTHKPASELGHQPWALASEDSVSLAEPSDEAHALITTPPVLATSFSSWSPVAKTLAVDTFAVPRNPISGPALFPLTLHTPRITHAACLGQGRGDFSAGTPIGAILLPDRIVLSFSQTPPTLPPDYSDRDPLLLETVHGSLLASPLTTGCSSRWHLRPCIM